MFSKPTNPVDLNIFAHHDIHPPNPAGGNPLDWPCPANSRVRITDIRSYTTTMAADSYHLVYIIPTAGSHLNYAACEIAPPAMASTHVRFSTGIRTSLYLAPQNLITTHLPVDIFLEPGETLRLTTYAMGVNVLLAGIYIAFDQWIIA